MEQTIYDITLELQQACAPWALTVKKGDTHRRLRLRLLSGGSPYPIADDCYAVFTAQKPDGTVIYNPCTREGSTLIYDLTPQTTAATGMLNCEVKLYGPEDALLTSAAFILNVEDTVYTQGEEVITSTGEASALTQLITQARDTIEDMEKVLENEANHAVIDDTKVGSDAWSAKNIVDKLCPAFEESGAVVQCEPVEGYPLGVVTQITPVQSGSGDPSPENIRPITGYTACNLYHSGKNLFNYETLGALRSLNNDVVLTEIENGVRATATRGASGTISTIGRWLPISVLDGKTIRISVTMKRSVGRLSPMLAVGYVNTDLSLRKIVTETVATGDVTKATVNFNVSTTDAEGRTYIGLWFYINLSNHTTQVGDYVDFTDFQIEIGDTATKYEPYKGNTFTMELGQAIYGGSLDWKTGVLTVTHGNIDAYTGEEVPDGWISSTGQLSEGVQVVYPLSPPITVQLTSQEVLALSGTNCLYSDIADTEVTGKADPSAVIEKLTNAIIALGGNV